jgi:hypothetical protein
MGNRTVLVTTVYSAISANGVITDEPNCFPFLRGLDPEEF